MINRQKRGLFLPAVLRAANVRCGSKSGNTHDEQRFSAIPPESVAKVFLRHGSQILRGVGAAIDQRCGGPRRHTPNSQAILAAGLRLYRAAIVACFVLWREFSSCGFWDFCNTICQEPTSLDHFVSAAEEGDWDGEPARFVSFPVNY